MKSAQDERKQAKLQRLQNPSHTKGHNLNNVKREATRTFWNQRREYLNEKINELETSTSDTYTEA
jgi:hypothetical protein